MKKYTNFGHFRPSRANFDVKIGILIKKSTISSPRCLHTTRFWPFRGRFGWIGEVGDHILDLPVLILIELGEVGNHMLDMKRHLKPKTCHMMPSQGVRPRNENPWDAEVGPREGVGGGVNPSPRLVVWGLELVWRGLVDPEVFLQP